MKEAEAEMEGGRDGGRQRWREAEMVGGRDVGRQGWREAGMVGGRDEGWQRWKKAVMEEAEAGMEVVLGSKHLAIPPPNNILYG